MQQKIYNHINNYILITMVMVKYPNIMVKNIHLLCRNDCTKYYICVLHNFFD
jgi:hypothetical protein